MKKCSQCSRTYPDDTLAFCLEDGALLSASYYPQETQAPTAAFNAGEVPTVAANEIPTVMANEIPTVFNSSRLTEQIEVPRLRWYIYLIGFVASILIYIIDLYVITPPYLRLTDGLYDYIASALAELTYASHYIAGTLLSIPLNFIIYALMGLIVGFIWSEGRWKWGFVLILPKLFYRAYVCLDSLINGVEGAELYLISTVVILFIVTVIACFFSHLGSLLKKRIQAPAI